MDEIRVACPTRPEAVSLIDVLHEHGYTWRSGASALSKTEWHVNREQSIYVIDPVQSSFVVRHMPNGNEITVDEYISMTCSDSESEIDISSLL